MSNKTVEIYTTQWCPYCIRAKMLLEKKAVSFTEINAAHNSAERATMNQRSGRDTVPQIFIGEVHVGGCDDLYALEAKGQLDSLLKD